MYKKDTPRGTVANIAVKIWGTSWSDAIPRSDIVVSDPDALMIPFWEDTRSAWAFKVDEYGYRSVAGGANIDNEGKRTRNTVDLAVLTLSGLAHYFSLIPTIDLDKEVARLKWVEKDGDVLTGRSS